MQTEYGIKVLPIKIILNGKEYLETGIPSKNFYEPLAKFRNAPEIIPPSIDQIAEAFEVEIIKGNAVLAIFLSTHLNKIYENACKAKIKLMSIYPKANISIIDSMTTCMQQELAVLEAAELAQKDVGIADITKKTRDSIKHTRLYLVPKSFKYFEIAGLLKKYQVAMSNILQLFPILFIKDGKIIIQNIIQSKNKAIAKTMQLFENDSKVYEIDQVIVSHIADFDRAVQLAERVRKVSVANVYITEIEAVVGASLGPGTLGLAYSAVDELPEIEPKYITKI